MLRGNVVRLYPNKDQKYKIRQNCHASRFVYNLALEMKTMSFAQDISMSEHDINTWFNTVKKEEYSWLVKVDQWSLNKTIMKDLKSGYKNFLDGLNKVKIQDSLNLRNVLMLVLDLTAQL